MLNTKIVGEVKDDLLDFNFLDKIKVSLSEGIQRQYNKICDEGRVSGIDKKTQLDLKIKQLSIAKILVNIHRQNPKCLIESHLELAQIYKSLNYSEQAYEHNRSALKKFYIQFEVEGNLPLILMIYERLIESCYEMKSYNQTINYISQYNQVSKEHKDEIEFSIDYLKTEIYHGQTLYALNEFEKAEKQFLKVMMILSEKIEKNKDYKGFSIQQEKKEFLFEVKIQIYDYLYKIKCKEDKVQEQERYINDIINLIEEFEEDVKNLSLVFHYKSKYYLKQLDIITNHQNQFNPNNKDEIQAEISKRKEKFESYFKYLNKFLKQNDNFINQDNQKLLKQILGFIKEEKKEYLKINHFEMTYQILRIQELLEKFFSGEHSKKTAEIKFLKAIIMLNLEGKQAKAISIIKVVLKICRDLKFNSLFQSARDVLNQPEKYSQLLDDPDFKEEIFKLEYKQYIIILK